MIIWRGGGLLVILPAAIGIFAAVVLKPYVQGMNLDPALATALPSAGGALAACIFNWLLCKFLYRGGNSGHALYFIPAKAFTFIYALAIPVAGYMA